MPLDVFEHHMNTGNDEVSPLLGNEKVVGVGIHATLGMPLDVFEHHTNTGIDQVPPPLGNENIESEDGDQAALYHTDTEP
jgi:hypothetical protein